MRPLLSWIGILGAIAFSVPSIAQAQLSSTQERSLKPKATFKECDVCPEMVVVPAGVFRMGSPKNEKARSENEGPLHKVTIARRFSTMMALTCTEARSSAPARMAIANNNGTGRR